MSNHSTTGVLIVNLGTPKSYSVSDVKTYLTEFLTDPRVINLPWLQRQLLVRGLIVPFRSRQSASYYKAIWTEQGSPLMVHSQALKNELQKALGANYSVALAMRYQIPSIKEALTELRKKQHKKIIILPLFPQYASATTGSVHQKVMDEIREWEVIPDVKFINSFYNHPDFINAICESANKHSIEEYDHVLFSFHGLPEKQIFRADATKTCKIGQCCDCVKSDNQFCYRAQCNETARRVASQLSINPSKYTISFQSRLGKDPWITPYTSEKMTELAQGGIKKILVFCPSFVCDCLETTYEIGVEYQHEFKKQGGERLELVEGLNTHPSWIEALKTLVLESSR